MKQIRAVRPEKNPVRLVPRIGELLVDMGKLSRDDAVKVVDFQRERALLFGDAAVQMRLLQRQDVDNALSSQRVLSGRDRNNTRLGTDIVIIHKPISAQAEAIRNIAAHLLALMKKNTPFQFVVTSVHKSEGRTHCAANIASCLAMLGKRTLLVDGNLRSGRLHEIFGLPAHSGLSSALNGESMSDGTIEITELPGLTVLPAGPRAPNAMELIGAERASILFADFSNRYDVVIVDTPAGSLHAEAKLLAAHCGKALFLSRKNITQIDEAKRYIEELQMFGVEMIGAVVNEH